MTEAGLMAEALARRVAAITGRHVAAIEPLHGGSIAEVFKVDLVGGQRVVAKQAKGDQPNAFETEAFMLEALRQTETVPVPPTLHAEPDLLVLEWIEHRQGVPNPAAQGDAAERIAALHGIAGEAFGYERDTLIGPLPQPNPRYDHWIEFFVEHRLLHMARVALDSGALPSFTMEKVEDVASQMDDLLIEPERPSLLHGDLWAGNLLFSGDRLGALIDPAIYWGAPEIELAYSTLFGSLDNHFYDRYSEIRTIAPGFFEVRRDLYILYPLLVHLHLFGRTYLPPITKILDRHRRR
ncbi:MAG: fructosamine kinase family protein [Pseudomonadota bacterium]